MSKTLKTILIIVAIVVVLGFVVYLFFGDSKLLGGLIAMVTTAWASFKAKLFSPSKTEQEITAEHETTRRNWDLLKSEYDSRINALKARMDYIDYRSAKISEQINDLKKEEKAKIDQFNQMNDKEKEDFVNNLLNTP